MAPLYGRGFRTLGLLGCTPVPIAIAFAATEVKDGHEKRLIEIAAWGQNFHSKHESEEELGSSRNALMRTSPSLRDDAPLIDRYLERDYVSDEGLDNTQRLKELVEEDATLAEELAFERAVKEIASIVGFSALAGAIIFPVIWLLNAGMTKIRRASEAVKVEQESEAPGFSIGKWARSHPFTCMSLCEFTLLLILVITIITLSYKAWNDFCAVAKAVGEVSSSLAFYFYEQLTRGWTVAKVLGAMGVSGEQFLPMVDNKSPHELSIDFFTAVIKLDSGSAVELLGKALVVAPGTIANMTVTGKVLPPSAKLGDLPTAASSILSTEGVHLGKELAEIALLIDLRGKLGREKFVISGEVSVPCLSKSLKNNGQPIFENAVFGKVQECMIDGLLQYRGERRAMIDVPQMACNSRSMTAVWAMTWISAVISFACTGKFCIASVSSVVDRSYAREGSQPSS